MPALAECKTCENLRGIPLLEFKTSKGGCATFLLCNHVVVSCCVLRTGNDYTLLSGICNPSGTCWSWRESSWRRKRKSGCQRARLYLGASSTFSWTWGTWWTKSAVRYHSSTVVLLKSTHAVSTLSPHTFSRKWHQDWSTLFCFPLQMSKMKRSWVKPTSLTVRTHLNPEANSKTVWDSRVEGYIILRDLDLYLTKLARDFLLLASRTRIWLDTEKEQ